MMLLGMGTVVIMLIVLMVVLMLLGRLDKQPAPEIEEAPATPEVETGLETDTAQPVDNKAWMTIADDSGLTPEQIAAVSVAVATHADVRRKQGALKNRVYAPGSRLWASRWVAQGRSTQMSNTRRR